MNKESTKKKWLNAVKFLAGYLVAAWTFLQFFEWILKRYSISPNWVDVFLWLFIGIVPSLLIYFYHQERLSKGMLKLREKILFPLNIVLLTFALYLGFGNSDLGATTKEISYTNDEGQIKEQIITKEEFRVGLPIYNFKQLDTNENYKWLSYGIGQLLFNDLLQDKNISPYTSSSESTTDKVMQAKIFNDYYLDGTYQVSDNIYTVTPAVRNAKNGKVLAEKEFKGENLLDLLDDVSVFTKKHIGISKDKQEFYVDLDLKEFFSPSLEAIKYSMTDNHEKAQEIDSTFAMSYLYDAAARIRFSSGKLEEQLKIDKAFRYSNKLPLQRQLEVRIRRHIAYEEWDTAEKLLKLQLEIDPSDPYYNNLLYTVFAETKQIDAYVAHAEKRYEKNKNIKNGATLLNASLLLGREEFVISSLKGLELMQPNNTDLFTFKLRPQLLAGQIEDAKKTQEKTKLMHPSWDKFSKTYDIAIDYLSKNEVTTDKLRTFEGLFRSDVSEQTIEFWLYKNRLIQYVSNQRLRRQILAGESTLVDGDYLNSRVTYKRQFLKDSANNIYVVKSTQYGFSGAFDFWYWRYDDALKTFENALENGEIAKADTMYASLKSKFPHHYFLDEARKHLDYLKSTDSTEIQGQLKRIVGQYGPRKFYLDNGQLYYKRVGLPKTHLLPLGNDQFMSLSRYKTQIGFEKSATNEMASYSMSYDVEKMEWNKAKPTDTLNYKLKTK